METLLLQYVSHSFLNVALPICVVRDAWNSLGNMTKEEAMMNYIEDIQLVSPTDEDQLDTIL